MVATSILLVVGAGVASAEPAASHQQPPPEEVTVDGFTFTAVPDGNRYLVDTEIDPDGYIANPNVASRQALAAALPPPCVTATVDPPGIATQTVRVTNGCAQQQRVKVLAAFSNDSGCLILNPGQVGTHAFNILNQFTALPDARFDGLEAC